MAQNREDTWDTAPGPSCSPVTNDRKGGKRGRKSRRRGQKQLTPKEAPEPKPTRIQDYNCHRSRCYEYVYDLRSNSQQPVVICSPCYNKRKENGRYTKGFKYWDEHYMNEAKITYLKCEDCKERFGTTRPVDQCVECVIKFAREASINGPTINYQHPCPPAPEAPKVCVNNELMEFFRDNVEGFGFLKDLPNKKLP